MRRLPLKSPDQRLGCHSVARARDRQHSGRRAWGSGLSSLTNGVAHWQRRSKSSSTHQGSPARVCGGQRCRIDAQDIADLLGGFLPARGRGIGVLVGQQPADLLGVPAVRASALRRRQLPQSQSDHPQVVFARLGSSTWEGAYDARTAGVPVSKHRAAMRVTWVIDASVGCALGTWTGALSIVPGDGRRRPALAGRLCVLSSQ